ncbi:MAG: hypothetical protein ACR5LF_14370 [Symbiopectobacterium sp.]
MWGGDVTYVWTGKCCAYLAVVLDLFARKLFSTCSPENQWAGQSVGWAISFSPDSQLTTKALEIH